MPIDVSLLSAFLVGLLGGVHCVGMCGGIVGALSLGLPEQLRTGPARWRYLVAYNLARISSYTVAGALLGGIGWMAANWSGVHQLQLGLHILAALFMVALGLYLGGWWQGLVPLERMGGLIWKRLEPLGRRCLPVRTAGQAFLLGLVWGWLPCGLVYSVLLLAATTANAANGGLVMVAFGIGTMPAMIATGVSASALSQFMSRKRLGAGLLIVLIGLLTLAMPVMKLSAGADKASRGHHSMSSVGFQPPLQPLQRRFGVQQAAHVVDERVALIDFFQLVGHAEKKRMG